MKSVKKTNTLNDWGTLIIYDTRWFNQDGTENWFAFSEDGNSVWIESQGVWIDNNTGINFSEIDFTSPPINNQPITDQPDKQDKPDQSIEPKDIMKWIPLVTMVMVWGLYLIRKDK